MGLVFNTYITLITLKQPDRFKDLLAYSSVIVNASKQYPLDGIRCRKEAAVQPGLQWACIDASTWTLCFTGAKPKPAIVGAQKGHEKRFHPYAYKSMDNICRNHRCFRKDCRYRHVCVRCEKLTHTDDQCPERGTFCPQPKPL